MTYQFDHAMCAVPTLEAGTRLYENLGFVCHEGGKHTVGTQNSVVPLEIGYLELLSLHDRQAALRSPRHRLILDYIDREGAGLIGFALRTTTVEEDAERLGASGYEFEGPVVAQRTRPDGVVLEWRVLRLTPQPCPAVVPMLVSGDQSAPDFVGNPNGVTRASGIAMVTADVDALVKKYQVLVNAEPSGTRERGDIGASSTYFDLDGFRVDILAAHDRGYARDALTRHGDVPIELSYQAATADKIADLSGIALDDDGVVVLPPVVGAGMRVVVAPA